MDRQTIYFGQIPLETDLLNAQQDAMVALAKFCAAVLGATTIVNGFTCTPTAPATLNVLLTAGEVYQIENLEQSQWSSLPANTAVSILKQGIQLQPVQFAITPPGTVGFSQVFLIEVQYQDLDTGLVTLPYFNANNPSAPFSGPGNSGTAQNTKRTGIVATQVKAGIAATTGTQVAPTADPGWTGLFLITVANGQATITAGNITQVVGAPFIPATLPNVPLGVQDGTWVYAVDTGSVNALAATISPAPLSLVAGMQVRVKAANGNTGASTFNLNGLGAVAIHRANGSALSSGDINPSMVMGLNYDGSAWQIENYFGFTATTTNNNNFVLTIPYGTDIGSTNAMAVTFSPAITGPNAGQFVLVKCGHTNTGPVTFNPNGLGAAPVIHPNGTALNAGELVAGGICEMCFDGTNWQLENLSFSTLLTANTNYYVSGGTGSDSNNGLTPSTAWATIQHATTFVGNLNLNGFTATINVADWASNYAPFTLPRLNGVGTAQIIGDTTTPANVTVSAAIGPCCYTVVQGVTGWVIGGLKFQSAAAYTVFPFWPGSGVWIANGGTIQLYDCEFGACASACMLAQDGLIQCLGPDAPGSNGQLRFSGNSTAAAWAQQAGQIQFDTVNLVFPVVVSFSVATIVANLLSMCQILVGTVTSGGNCNGVRFSATQNSVINTNTGGSATAIPGSSPGVLATGGLYS